MSLTMEQVERRKKGLGGSDISAIVGLSHYRSEFEVYLSKVGETVQKEETGPMEWGLRHEDAIAKKFAEKNGVDVIDPEGEIFTHPDNPILRCMPDRFALNGKREQLELKTADAHIASRWGFGEDEAPQEYLIQVTWNSNILRALGVVDGDMNHLAALIGGNDYRQYKVPHDQELADMLVEKANAWWKAHIETKTPPEIDGSQAAQDWIRRKFPDNVAPMIESDEKIDELAISLRDLRVDLAEMELKEDALKNKMRHAIGDNDGVIGGWGKAYNRKSKDKTTVDYKGLIEKLKVPKILMDEFSAKSDGVRSFKFYPKKKGV